MKKIKLEGNTPIVIPKGRFIHDDKECHFDERRYFMRVFTDGSILREEEPVESSEEEIKSIAKKHECYINNLETRNLFLKDYTYVVTRTIVRKWARVGNVGGWFSFAVDTNVYMKDPKDRKAKKTVKKLLYDFDQNNRSANYYSLWSYTFGQRSGLADFDSEKISDEVYSLKLTSKS